MALKDLKTKPAPAVTGLDDVGPEIIAQSIVDIATGMKAITASRLSRRALIVLLKDVSGVSHSNIIKVLDALEDLKTVYTKR